MGEDYIYSNTLSQFSEKLRETIKHDVKNKFGHSDEVSVQITEDNKLHIFFHTPIKNEVFQYINETYKPDKIHLAKE